MKRCPFCQSGSCDFHHLVTVPGAALALGLGKSAVRKAITRGAVVAYVNPRGYHNRPEYVIPWSEVVAYGERVGRPVGEEQLS